MDLNKVTPSKNFVDHVQDSWAEQPMGMNLWMNLLKQHDLSNQGAPGGYSNWLKETFNDLSPKEVDMMKSHGMTIQDIWVLRNFLKGNVEIDPSVYPYSDEAAEAAVKRLRHAR